MKKKKKSTPEYLYKCSMCGDVSVKPMNGIHKNWGIFYYCKKKLCQERFVEDAGEMPDET